MNRDKVDVSSVSTSSPSLGSLSALVFLFSVVKVRPGPGESSLYSQACCRSPLSSHRSILSALTVPHIFSAAATGALGPSSTSKANSSKGRTPPSKGMWTWMLRGEGRAHSLSSSSIRFYFRLIYLFYVNEHFPWLSIRVPHACLEVRDGHRRFWIQVTESWESTFGYWESNLGLLQKQQVYSEPLSELFIPKPRAFLFLRTCFLTVWIVSFRYCS